MVRPEDKIVFYEVDKVTLCYLMLQSPPAVALKVRHLPINSRRSYTEERIGQLGTAELMDVAAVGVGSLIGLGCWLIGNQPSALVDWQSASS